jgi:hypothetical protein
MNMAGRGGLSHFSDSIIKVSVIIWVWRGEEGERAEHVWLSQMKHNQMGGSQLYAGSFH